MARDFADLYKNRNGQHSWYHTLEPEPKEWLEELAVYIDEKGREPTWSAVWERFAELFPDQTPKGQNTISATVRRLRG